MFANMFFVRFIDLLKALGFGHKDHPYVSGKTIRFIKAVNMREDKIVWMIVDVYYHSQLESYFNVWVDKVEGNSNDAAIDHEMGNGFLHMTVFHAENYSFIDQVVRLASRG